MNCFSMAPYKHDFGQTITTDGAQVVDRAFLAHVNIPKPAAADDDGILASKAALHEGEAPLVVTAFLAQPDWPRNITVKLSATTAGDIQAGAVKVDGLNAAGEAITESFTFADNTAATKTGAKAFAKVTKVTVPVQDGASVKVDVGWGNVFGLGYILSTASLVLLKLFGLSADTGTLAVNAALEQNTLALNGTPNGATDIDLYIIV